MFMIFQCYPFESGTVNNFVTTFDISCNFSVVPRHLSSSLLSMYLNIIHKITGIIKFKYSVVNQENKESK